MTGPHPFYLATPHGSRFCIRHAPPGACRGALLYVHPLAEEMNKSRRTAALLARALAAEGWLVLLPDLDGCGDSEGDFGATSWMRWLDDVTFALDWLAQESGQRPALWALRHG